MRDLCGCGEYLQFVQFCLPTWLSIQVYKQKVDGRMGLQTGF